MQAKFRATPQTFVRPAEHTWNRMVRTGSACPATDLSNTGSLESNTSGCCALLNQFLPVPLQASAYSGVVLPSHPLPGLNHDIHCWERGTVYAKTFPYLTLNAVPRSRVGNRLARHTDAQPR
jgi:hypothetical protein